MPLVLNGTTGVQDNSGAFVLGTAVASTSGTNIDFTSIPSWVKRLTVIFNGVSTNGSSGILIQLGDSGGVETTGYVSCSGQMYNTAAGTSTATNGFFYYANNDGGVFSGHTIITIVSSNQWIASGTIASSIAGAATQVALTTGGNKTLSDTLDRVRITTGNGTDTFDAGSINILYE
jgi:hypothetical protein